VISTNDRYAQGHRFQENHAKAFSAAWQREYLGVAIRGDKLGAIEAAYKVSSIADSD
jgi:hypothetical protein